jgi:DNA replication licensing factor MCM5
MNRANTETIEGDLDIQKMRSYISYCKTKCAPRLSPEAAEKLASHFVEMRAKVRGLNSDVTSNAKTAIPITVRQLEAIVRITEALAKMSLSPQATERHVDEAMRLFNVATMNAIQSGIEGVSRGQFSDEVQRVESYLLKRFPVGSEMSEKSLKDELIRKEFSEPCIDRVVHKLKGKQIFYQERRGRIRRVA